MTMGHASKAAGEAVGQSVKETFIYSRFPHQPSSLKVNHLTSRAWFFGKDERHEKRVAWQLPR
jgi:hypothetical protein